MIRTLAAALLLFFATGAQAQESIVTQLQKKPVDFFTFGLDRAGRALNSNLAIRKSETSAFLKFSKGEFRALGNATVPGAPDLRGLCEKIVADIKFAFLWNHQRGESQVTDGHGSVFALYFTPADQDPTGAMRDEMDSLFVVYGYATDTKSVVRCHSRMREKIVHFD